METGTRTRPDSSVRRYPVGTCRRIYPVLALAAAMFGMGFVPRAAAQGFVGYVANSADNTVSLLAMDGNNNVVTGLNGASPQTVTVGTSPVRVAVAPNSGLVFVTNKGANSITVIDPTTNTALSTTIQIQPIGSGPAPSPQGIAVLESESGLILYVANSGDNSVSVIDASNIKTGTFTQVARITKGIGTTPIEVVIQGGNAYVLNNNQGGVGTVSIIDIATNTASAPTPAIQVAHNASGLAASPDGQMVYVTNRGDNSVTAINVSNLVQLQITGVTDPVGVAFDPNPGDQNAQNRVAYVANSSTGTVTEIIDDAICDNNQNGNCFNPNPLPLPTGAHPSQIQVVAGNNGSMVFISDPVSGKVYSFVPFDTPTPTTLAAGNAASGLGFFAFPDNTNPNPPVCGLTQNFDLQSGGDNVTGICVGGGVNGTSPGLSFWTGGGFSCSGNGPNVPCAGQNGSVGGFQDYSQATAGVYTVIVCSDKTQVPPNCTGGRLATQLVAWPGLGNTAPTVTCPQFTATPDATLGLTADASGSCDDGIFTLPNQTNPLVNLSLVVRVDWGDGSIPALQTGTQATGNKITATHQYAKAGTYNVTLSAGDTTLLAATPQTKSVTVTDAPPTCTFAPPSVADFQVTAAPTCFDEFGKPVTQISIDWGQGVPGSPTVVTGASVNQPVSFTYPTKTTQTTYTISVVGTAKALSSTPVTQQVIVPSFVPQPPSCSVSATATLLAAQAPVTCNATAQGDTIKSVAISWGDGSSNTATPGTATFTNTFQHTYASVSKTYTISVTATDATGLQSTPVTTSLAITGPVPPRCTLSAQSTGGFSVSATAQCIDDDAALLSIAVDFGDGTVVPGTPAGPNFGPQTFTHTYAAAGTFNITLTASDAQELTTKVTASATVPTLVISGSSQATVTAGGTATFTITVPQGLTVANPPLTLSCVPNAPQTSLPAGVVCLFSPANINPGQSSTLTIATNSVAPATANALRIPSLYGLGLALLPAMLLMGSGERNRKTGACRFVVACLVMLLILGMAGCGTNTPAVSPAANSTPGTFTVLVQAADATQKVLGTSTLTLTINK